MSAIKKYLSYEYPVRLTPTEVDGTAWWVAEHPDLPGCVSDGATPTEAVDSLSEARVAWIEMKVEFGESVPEPTTESEFSGKFLLRMPKSLHRTLSDAARSEKVSLNQLTVSMLSRMVGREDVESEVTKVGRDVDRLLAMVQTLYQHP